jgi:hypothetical protein
VIVVWRLALMLVLVGAGRGFAAGAGLGAVLAPAFGLSPLGSGAGFLFVVPIVPRLRLAMHTVTLVGAALVTGVWLLRLVLQPAAPAP